MMAHRGDQDFLGQRHESLVDPAEQDDRPLDQPGELGEQRRIVAQAQILLARKPAASLAIARCRSAPSSWT